MRVRVTYGAAQYTTTIHSMLIMAATGTASVLIFNKVIAIIRF